MRIAPSSGMPADDQKSAHHAGEPVERANREVHFGNDQDIGRADGKNAKQGNLPQQIENVGARQKNRTRERKK